MEEIIRAPEAAGTGACGAQPAPAEEPVKQPPGPGWLEKLRQGLSGQERTTSPRRSRRGGHRRDSLPAQLYRNGGRRAPGGGVRAPGD